MNLRHSEEHWAWLLDQWRIERRRSAEYIQSKRERPPEEPPALPRFAMPSFDERRAA